MRKNFFWAVFGLCLGYAISMVSQVNIYSFFGVIFGVLIIAGLEFAMTGKVVIE